MVASTKNMNGRDDRGNGDENDYWYMGTAPVNAAQVAFTLYGVRKDAKTTGLFGRTRRGCNSGTYINSFYSAAGFNAYAAALYAAGVTSLANYANSDGGGDDNGGGPTSAKCGNGYGVTCNATGAFSYNEYAYQSSGGTVCDSDNFVAVVDPLDDLNAALAASGCFEIYNADTVVANNDNSYLPVQTLLTYSASCSLQDLAGSSCPDPYHVLKRNDQRLAAAITTSSLSSTQALYRDRVVASSIMFACTGFLLLSTMAIVIREVQRELITRRKARHLRRKEMRKRREQRKLNMAQRRNTRDDDSSGGDAPTVASMASSVSLSVASVAERLFPSSKSAKSGESFWKRAKRIIKGGGGLPKRTTELELPSVHKSYVSPTSAEQHQQYDSNYYRQQSSSTLDPAMERKILKEAAEDLERQRNVTAAFISDEGSAMSEVSQYPTESNNFSSLWGWIGGTEAPVTIATTPDETTGAAAPAIPLSHVGEVADIDKRPKNTTAAAVLDVDTKMQEVQPQPSETTNIPSLWGWMGGILDPSTTVTTLDDTTDTDAANLLAHVKEVADNDERHRNTTAAVPFDETKLQEVPQPSETENFPSLRGGTDVPVTTVTSATTLDDAIAANASAISSSGSIGHPEDCTGVPDESLDGSEREHRRLDGSTGIVEKVMNGLPVDAAWKQLHEEPEGKATSGDTWTGGFSGSFDDACHSFDDSFLDDHSHSTPGAGDLDEGLNKSFTSAASKYTAETSYSRLSATRRARALGEAFKSERAVASERAAALVPSEAFAPPVPVDVNVPSRKPVGVRTFRTRLEKEMQESEARTSPANEAHQSHRSNDGKPVDLRSYLTLRQGSNAEMRSALSRRKNGPSHDEGDVDDERSHERPQGESTDTNDSVRAATENRPSGANATQATRYRERAKSISDTVAVPTAEEGVKSRIDLGEANAIPKGGPASMFKSKDGRRAALIYFRKLGTRTPKEKLASYENDAPPPPTMTPPQEIGFEVARRAELMRASGFARTGSIIPSPHSKDAYDGSFGSFDDDNNTWAMGRVLNTASYPDAIPNCLSDGPSNRKKERRLGRLRKSSSRS